MIYAARLAWARLWAHVQYTLRPLFPRVRHVDQFNPPIEHWLKTLPDDTRFIQVGSNDGAQGDPLHEFIVGRRWTGALVEPVPYLFEKLKKNYAAQSDRLIFVNAAISSEIGQMDLFYVLEESKDSLDLPYWYDQLGSFDRGHIVRHLGDEIEPFIRAQPVDCILFDDLIMRAGLSGFDLLHVDVEGHDYEIIRQVDLVRYRPTMVLFEMKHLKAADRKSAIAKFMRHGYRMVFYGADALAIRREAKAG